jgi:hypothetical protein
MALNASGPISLGGATTGESIATELGLGSATLISMDQIEVRTLAGVASGMIVMPLDFWGKSSSSFTEFVAYTPQVTGAIYTGPAEDSSNNLYVAAGNTITKVLVNGTIDWTATYSGFTSPFTGIGLSPDGSKLYYQATVTAYTSRTKSALGTLSTTNGSIINQYFLDVFTTTTGNSSSRGFRVTPGGYIHTSHRYSGFPGPSISSRFYVWDSNLNNTTGRTGSGSISTNSNYTSRGGSDSWVALRNAPSGFRCITKIEENGTFPGYAINTGAPTSGTTTVSGNTVTGDLALGGFDSTALQIVNLSSSDSVKWTQVSQFTRPEIGWDEVNNKAITYYNNLGQIGILNGDTGVQEKNYLITSTLVDPIYRVKTTSDNGILFEIIDQSSTKGIFILKLDAATYRSRFDSTFTATVGGETFTITPYPSGTAGALLFPAPGTTTITTNTSTCPAGTVTARNPSSVTATTGAPAVFTSTTL